VCAQSNLAFADRDDVSFEVHEADEQDADDHVLACARIAGLA
jgi:hypothetical protein